MKKRLLITSIVMMLVCAVALSTATYAWFTSNQSVTASSITMYAATNEAASIGISWTNSGFGTTISAETPSSETKFKPTAISTIAANTAFDSITWASATVKQEGGVDKFNADVIDDSDVLCYTWNDGSGVGANHTSFFIHNGSGTNQLSAITATTTITGDASNFIRVGFFKKDTNNNGTTFKLKGVITDGFAYTAASGTSVDGTKYYNLNGEEVLTGDGTTAIPANSFTRAAKAAGDKTAAVGTVTAGQNVSNITDTTIETSVNLGGLTYDGYDPTAEGNNNAPGIDTMEIMVLVWMDGSALNDETAGSSSKSASVMLHFDATRGTYVHDTFGN